MVDTAQTRTKVWIDTYWTASNITKDNGSDLATIITAFDFPDYPLTRVFIDKDVDGIVSIGQSNGMEIADSDHYTIGYEERVPITFATCDKAGVTGIKLLAKLEAELRRIQETYPIVVGTGASLRRTTGDVPKTQRIGSFYLFSSEYTLNYKRDVT
jgi:hypothetical protein